LSIVRTDPFPTYDAEEDIRRVLDAGASGYLLKDSSQDDLIMPRNRTGGILANRSGDNASGMDHFVTRADWHRWG